MQIIDINGNTRECAKAYPDNSYPGYMKIEYKTQVRSYSDWYPIKDFIANNPTLTHLATHASPVAIDDLGVVTKCAPLTLKDKTKKWQVNTYADFPLWITRSKGEGQTRTEVSNTHNTLTVDKARDVIPDDSSQYVLSHNIHDPQALGNTLPTEEVVMAATTDVKIEIDSIK